MRSAPGALRGKETKGSQRFFTRLWGQSAVRGIIQMASPGDEVMRIKAVVYVERRSVSPERRERSPTAKGSRFPNGKDA